jgi:hypothetical protein
MGGDRQGKSECREQGILDGLTFHSDDLLEIER